MPAPESTPTSTDLSIDLLAEKIVSIVSKTSEVTGSHKNASDEGLLIEGTFVGEIDVGNGTVAIAKGAVFVGSMRAGKLLSDGKILNDQPQGQAATTKGGRIDISGTIVLGPSSQTQVDCHYGELEVMRGAKILARLEARRSDEPKPQETLRPTATPPVVGRVSGLAILSSSERGDAAQDAA
jgi:cytoskeletal protein CcmA (bactofilin family)